MSAETSRYVQIAEIIRNRIMRGELKPGQRLPGESELAAEFEVSASTIWQAIASLRDRNYLWTMSRPGSYVRPPEHWREEAE